jgi:hypothetical protein
LPVQGFECQTAGHGSKLVAGPDAFGAESAGENASDRGHERRSAGEEDAIHVAPRDPGSFQQRVDADFDMPQILGDPFFECAALYVGLEIDEAVGKLKSR